MQHCVHLKLYTTETSDTPACPEATLQLVQERIRALGYVSKDRDELALRPLLYLQAKGWTRQSSVGRGSRLSWKRPLEETAGRDAGREAAVSWKRHPPDQCGAAVGMWSALGSRRSNEAACSDLAFPHTTKLQMRTKTCAVCGTPRQLRARSRYTHTPGGAVRRHSNLPRWGARLSWCRAPPRRPA